MHFFVDFACDGNSSAQIQSEPIYCPVVINPSTPRPLTGVHGDQMHEVLLYMVGEDAKIAGLHAKARLLKRHRLWEMLYLHPENTLVHLSRRMPLSFPTVWFSWFEPPPPHGGHSTVWAPVVPSAPCLPSERSRYATGSQIACQVPKGIKTVAGKVELEYCKSYAKLGVCPTSAAMDR